MEITGKRYAGNDWRKLLSTRRGTTVVAVVCTLIAAGIIVFAMHRYRQSVNASGQPETVLVATQLIQKGTTGTAIVSGHLFHSQQIVAKQVSAGAVADTSTITGKVATADIYPGQQLTLADFASSGDLSTQLGPNDRGISVPLVVAPGLVGQLQVGDHVDVYGSYNVIPVTGLLAGRTTPVSKVLVSNATVLKAGSVTSSGLSGSTATQISDVVLKVNKSDAVKVAFTSTNGVVWLVLRSANAAAPDPSQLVTLGSILFGTKSLAIGGTG